MTPKFYGFDVANTNYISYIADVIPGKKGNLPSSQRTRQRWPRHHPALLNNAPTNVGRYGNAHANSLLGPRLDAHHLSVFKTFPITERVRGTFTSEIADIFNHPLFYDPDTYINAPDVGQLVCARGDYEPRRQDIARSRSSCDSSFKCQEVPGRNRDSRAPALFVSGTA